MENSEKDTGFAAFGLSEKLLDTVRARGFSVPTPVQRLAVPALLDGSADLIPRAATGTGKTAAYALPVIDTLTRDTAAAGKVRALVLAPTRELAMQIGREMESLTPGGGLRYAVIFGGQAVEIQLAALRRGADVVIGTPGRVLDMLERGALSFAEVSFAVLDEADEMLDMGFIDDITAILEHTPPERRMLMFSATMPDEIRKVAERFMRNPQFVSADDGRGNSELKISQYAYEVKRDNKAAVLERLLAATDRPYAMVFCRTRADADELTLKLQRRGFPVEALHGDLAQSQRTRVISRFKSGQFRILVATDVAARGIDISGLTHVINYSLPQSADIYTHRIGRTGRAGESGTAVTFFTPGEKRKFNAIRTETGAEISLPALPDGGAVIAMKKEHFLRELVNSESSEEPSPGCRQFASELLSGGDAEQLVARLLQLRFRDELDISSYADLSAAPPRRGGKVFLRLDTGSEDGISPSRLMKLVAEKSGVWKSKMGKIEIGPHSSAVELPRRSAELALHLLRAARIRCEIEERPSAADNKPARLRGRRKKS